MNEILEWITTKNFSAAGVVIASFLFGAFAESVRSAFRQATHESRKRRSSNNGQAVDQFMKPNGNNSIFQRELRR